MWADSLSVVLISFNSSIICSGVCICPFVLCRVDCPPHFPAGCRWRGWCGLLPGPDCCEVDPPPCTLTGWTVVALNTWPAVAFLAGLWLVWLRLAFRFRVNLQTFPSRQIELNPLAYAFPPPPHFVLKTGSANDYRTISTCWESAHLAVWIGALVIVAIPVFHAVTPFRMAR
jgi:hypothetical protein